MTLKSSINVLVGENIRIIRGKKGVSQEALEALIDVSRSHISKIETGSGNPTLETIDKIAKALDITIAELLDFSNIKIDAGIADKKALIEIHSSALMKRNLKEIQYVFNATNDFLKFIDKK